MNHLRFFFDKEKDAVKLVWISQLIIKNSVNIMKQCEVERTLVFSIAHFLNLTLQYISNTIASSSSEIKGSHWRILEIFLNAQGWRLNVDIQTADNILGFIFGILSKKGICDETLHKNDCKNLPISFLQATSPCFGRLLMKKSPQWLSPQQKLQLLYLLVSWISFCNHLNLRQQL
jgi:hypothetical protein